ncbi:MAG: hypothetical protein OXN25_17800 [Candidatus Poribacteria bacterium]|nr:hypothetical protein [Candidatus Poribacteria bacterium]
MKKRRKIYQEIFIPQQYSLQGTFTEVVCILIVGIIAVVYLGYWYYVLRQQSQETIKKPVDIQQEGSIPTQGSSQLTLK